VRYGVTILLGALMAVQMVVGQPASGYAGGSPAQPATLERVKKSSGGCAFGGGGPRYTPVRGSDVVGACLWGYGREARYFRKNHDDATVFIGIGGSEMMHQLWPTYRVRPELRQIMSSNPAALDKLDKFDQRMAGGERMCCITTPIFFLGFVPLIYGLAADNKPALYGGIAVSGVSLALSWGGRLSATASFHLLDEAVDAYNSGRH